MALAIVNRPGDCILDPMPSALMVFRSDASPDRGAQHVARNARPSPGCSLRVSTDQHAAHGVRLDAQQARRPASAPLDALALVAVVVDAGVRCNPAEPQPWRHALHKPRYQILRWAGGRDEKQRGLCYDQPHVWRVTVVVTLPGVLRVGKWDRWARTVPHPNFGAISSDIGYRDVCVAQ